MMQLMSPDSGAMVIAGGACYETRRYPNMYNFCRLDLAAGKGSVYLRRYSDDRGGFWTRDVMTYRNVDDGVYTFELCIKLRIELPPSQSETQPSLSVTVETAEETAVRDVSV